MLSLSSLYVLIRERRVKLELGLYIQHFDYPQEAWRLLECVSVTTCINTVFAIVEVVHYTRRLRILLL